ncbi:CHAT domain-containing protein [Mycena galericulata]|nr:CHAT domain-containing protein [Mycena galericulata]
MTHSDIIIPPGFIDKFVWPPSKDIAADGTAEPIDDSSSDHPALPQSYAFPDSVLSEVLAAASYAFSPASQLGVMDLSKFDSRENDEGSSEEASESDSLDNDEDLPEEPSICLFTPYEGCHDIIDSMTQSVANQLDADVIVLDALELALGEFGALGKDIGRAISAVYERKPKLDSSRIQAAFDAIVTVSNKVQPCTGVDLTEPPKCRFIYLRDFGSIARSAKPFMARLLHAVRVRRSAAYEDENTSNRSSIPRPTVLIMGFDKASTIASEVDFSDTDSLFGFRNRYDRYKPYNPQPPSVSWSSLLSVGGSALRKRLPSLGSQLFRLKGEFSEISLQALPAALFLPLVSKSSQVETTALSSATNTVIPALRAECICLIPRDFQQNGVRDLTHRAEIKRKTDVQEALLLLFLRQKGVLVADDLLSLILNSAVSADTLSGGANPNNALLSDVLGDHPDIPFPVAVSRIATNAVGLAHRRPHGKAPIRIAAEDVSKAHAIFKEKLQTFSDWANEVEGRGKAEVKEDKLDEELSQPDTESSADRATSNAFEKNLAGEKEKKDPIVESVQNCEDLNEHEEKLLQCIVDCVSLTTTFDHVCIDPEIIQSLKDIVCLPLLYPAIFKIGILARESIGGILLYGLPGTGKTMVCRALARECGARMLQVRPSDVMNKWLGNSENLARNVFAMDGLQSARKNRDAGVVVVGATNRPFDLDEAVLRRLPTRLLVKIPDETRRKEILQIHLEGEAFPEVQLDEIARKTDDLCVSAATEAAKESVMNATADGTVVHAGRADLPSRVLAPKHFEHALTQVSPSTRNSSELDRWHKSFTGPMGVDEVGELIDTGSEMIKRFEISTRVSYLDAAVDLLGDAVSLCAPWHLQRPESLNSYAYALCSRFGQQGDMVDLEESIRCHREALELIPPSHPNRSDSLNNLASVLSVRFGQTGQLADLEESIAFHRQALELRPGSHPDRSISLNNLACALSMRFRQTGQVADLEESIAFHRQALDLRPGSHPDRSSSLNNLASALSTRFGQTGQVADLEESIAFHGQALELSPGSHPNRSRSLNNLASALSTRFEQTGQLADLEESIAFHRQALKLFPGSHPNRSSSLNNLANALSTRFEQTGQVADLEESIAFHRQALDLRPGSHPNRSDSLNNLASALSTRFEQTGQLADLEESIAFHQQALELRPGSHPDRSSSLSNLANALSTRFGQTGKVADLEESIAFHRQALELSPGSHPNRSRSLNNLASALSTRFEQTGQLTDLEESIAFHRQALELFPGSHPNRSSSLNNLANALSTRFEQTGQVADLEESISFHQQALELFPGSHPNRSSSLNNLASALSTRFEQTSQLTDLEESIAFNRQALELRPGSHPDRSISLNNLACALSVRFGQTGQVADLEEIIAFHQQALELRPGSHPDRSSSLNNLASALSTRFGQTGKVADLEESIAFLRQALDLRPGSHPNRSDSLNNLASALSTRFEQTGQLADLEESIAFHQQALELFPGSHPNRSDSLDNLASALSTRFQQTGQLADLEESIAFHQQALDLRPGSHPNRSSSLNNLANALSVQFGRTGQVADLEESIAFHRQALELFPGSHPNRSSSLNNLANALLTRFEQTGKVADLEESISFHQQALELFPGSHPNRSDSLNNLASALSTRFQQTRHLADLNEFQQTRQLADLNESMICFRDASAHETSSVIVRFRYSRQWAHKAASFHHSSAMEAYQYSIDLLPRLASLDLHIRQRQEALSRARGLACDACRYAIQEGQFDKAVEFLSAGRTVFWTQALQLRTPLDELQSVAPDLALKLRTISNALEATSAHDDSQSMQDSLQHIRDLEQEATRRRILNKDWNDTLEAVRKLKGFDGLLLPKSISKLRKASSNGPVVLLNAATSGCDALVVTQEEVKHIPLPDLAIETTQCLGDILRIALSSHGARSDPLQALLQPIRTNPRLKAVRMPTEGHTPKDLFEWVLGMLWFTVTRPVIDALELKVSKFQKPDDKGPLPRIWWCPTGPFAFLPIHAAGVYEGNNPESLSDYAISSYTPTLDALLASSAPKVHEPKILAVAQPEMPGDHRLDLPFTLKELDMIERHVPTTWLTKLGTKEEPTSVGRVLSLLPDASFVHFACHGSQDLVNPLESALLLGDGDLKVSKIMKTPIQNGSLAFLSACETAMGDEKVPDEAIHLAGTMLFAGFRGVVGTMWTMHDEDGPEVVDVFYNHIFGTSPESHPDSTKAAEALHLVVKKLQTEKKASFQRWIPFIHFGL